MVKLLKMIDLEKQIFKQIERAKNILIVFPEEKSGDSLSAALAFFIFLKNIKKNADIVEAKSSLTKNNYPENNLSFLPLFKKIERNIANLRSFIISLDIKNTKVSQIKYSVSDDQLNFIVSPSSGWIQAEDVSLKTGDFKYDLIITIGLSDLESLGYLYDNNVEFFYKTTIINIDNSAANEEFGQINFIDLNSLSISEIIYYLIKNQGVEKINEEVSTCLLAGIIKKTKNFKIENLNPKTLLTSSELISLGAKREEIVNNLFYSKTIDSLKIWGEILKNLNSEILGEFLWSRIKNEDIQENQLEKETLEEIIDDLISGLPKAKVFVLLIEKEEGLIIKVFSLKSSNAISLIKEFSPKGGFAFAEAFCNKKEKSESEIINIIKNNFEKPFLNN